MLEICRINVSTFFITFFSISLLFCFLSSYLCPHKIIVFSLLLCLFFFAFVLSAVVFERDTRGKEVSEREHGGIHLAFWEQYYEYEEQQ